MCTVSNKLSRNAAEMEAHLPNSDLRVFRQWSRNAKLEETRLDTGEAAVHVIPGSKQLCVVVAGRVSVDSSPDLRSALLRVLSRTEVPLLVIDLSEVTYLDMSGLATLLEAVKAARERSMKLRMTGLSGAARNLVEIAQLDTIFRAWGSELDFQ